MAILHYVSAGVSSTTNLLNKSHTPTEVYRLAKKEIQVGASK